MFTRPLLLLLALVCTCVTPAHAQMQEPSGVILRGAVGDSAWSRDSVPEHVRRCRSRQMAQLIVSPFAGFLGGVLLHALIPREMRSDAGARFGAIGAAIALATAAGNVVTVDCAQQPLPERPPMRQPPRQRPW